MSDGTQYLMLATGLGVLLSAAQNGRMRPLNVSKFLREDDGAAYSIGMTLVTPFYTLLICVVIECTLMMVVKMGTYHAALAAARSASVWLPAEQTDGYATHPGPGMVQLAAVQAMTPFSSSTARHRVQRTVFDDVGDANYDQAYRKWAATSELQSERYVQLKREYAAEATSIHFDPPLPELMQNPRSRLADESVAVTVIYEMPMNVPGVGRIFGSRSSLPGASFYSRKISSTVTLNLERPRSVNRRLGIEYDSRAHNYSPRIGTR